MINASGARSLHSPYATALYRLITGRWQPMRSFLITLTQEVKNTHHSPGSGRKAGTNYGSAIDGRACAEPSPLRRGPLPPISTAPRGPGKS